MGRHNKRKKERFSIGFQTTPTPSVASPGRKVDLVDTHGRGERAPAAPAGTRFCRQSSRGFLAEGEMIDGRSARSGVAERLGCHPVPPHPSLNSNVRASALLRPRTGPRTAHGPI